MRSILCSIFCLLTLSGCALQNGGWVRKGFAPVSNGKLYYEAAGSGPAVVLIHGGQLDCRLWDEQWRLLAEEFRVIRYDVRGFGKRSPRGRGCLQRNWPAEIDKFRPSEELR